MISSWCSNLDIECTTIGWAYHFFKESESSRLRFVPSGCRSLICMMENNVILKMIVVCVTLAWSSWAAYPFMSSAVNLSRKALALYPVFLMYVFVGFLIIAVD
ncbi:hypothetical protein GOBAR_AA08854 [Gossypium barbadense]|uniref:Protein YIP n=1 Tax=Gossypium barbadense TaxID=3634 RepID=A0A2P5Y884_GOSBA|nr:hypothetical protein GOBAR_AA08854 [Gossypium barbadense]